MTKPRHRNSQQQIRLGAQAAAVGIAGIILIFLCATLLIGLANHYRVVSTASVYEDRELWLESFSAFALSSD